MYRNSVYNIYLKRKITSLQFNTFYKKKSLLLQQTTHALYGNDAISHRQPAQRCCETGRPIATDPVTGSIVCSCQIQPGSQSYLSRVPRLPEHIYGPTQSQIPAGLSGIGQPAFYSMVSSPAKLDWFGLNNTKLRNAPAKI